MMTIFRLTKLKNPSFSHRLQLIANLQKLGSALFEAVVAASGKEVSQMKPGDYTIHLLIQKAKDLNISEEGTINVIVEVEVQGKKEISKEIKEVSATTVCNFGSHIFFELFKQSVA